MKKYILCVIPALLLITSCASNVDDVNKPVLTTVQTPSTTTQIERNILTNRTTSASDIAENVQEESITEEAYIEEPENVLVPDHNANNLPPAVVECSQTDPGWSIWSDGTESYTNYCELIISEQQQYDQQQDTLQQDHLWGGYTSGGQEIYPKQQYDTSGGAQTHHGCLEGYIDNPEMCNKTYDKYGYPQEVLQ